MDAHLNDDELDAILESALVGIEDDEVEQKEAKQKKEEMQKKEVAQSSASPAGERQHSDKEAADASADAELQASFAMAEEMLKKMGLGGEGEGPGMGEMASLLENAAREFAERSGEASESSGSGSTGGDSIEETLERLAHTARQAEEGMSSGATDGMSEKEIREMLEALEGGEGEGLMGGILNELMSREVLEEPMRDLLSKYPEWLAQEGESMSAEKIEVCEQQLAIVREICGIYDNEPDEKEQVKQVTVLMEKMQALGPMPVDLMKQMSPDVQFDENGLPKINPADCPIL